MDFAATLNAMGIKPESGCPMLIVSGGLVQWSAASQQWVNL